MARTEVVDPRDVTWEFDNEPRFRARAWRREIDHPDSIWRCTEHRFAPDTGLSDALVWLGEQTEDVTLYAEVAVAGLGLGLVRLLGAEPADARGAPSSNF